jgi:hypothetical protein
MERGGTGVNLRTVTLQHIGNTRSDIRLHLQPRADRTARHLADRCRLRGAMHRERAASPMLINPFTARTSETVVNLPSPTCRPRNI